MRVLVTLLITVSAVATVRAQSNGGSPVYTGQNYSQVQGNHYSSGTYSRSAYQPRATYSRSTYPPGHGSHYYQQRYPQQAYSYQPQVQQPQFGAGFGTPYTDQVQQAAQANAHRQQHNDHQKQERWRQYQLQQAQQRAYIQRYGDAASQQSGRIFTDTTAQTTTRASMDTRTRGKVGRARTSMATRLTISRGAARTSRIPASIVKADSIKVSRFTVSTISSSRKSATGGIDSPSGCGRSREPRLMLPRPLEFGGANS